MISPSGRPRPDQRLLALIPYGVPYGGGVTVAELVRRSGLSRPTVAEALDRLLADGAVRCGPGAGSGGVGRPARRWRRGPPQGMFAAIALSRDAVRVRVADGDDGDDGKVADRLHRLDVSLDAHGALSTGRDLLHECLTELTTGAESLATVVLGLPCPVGDDEQPQARGILPGWIGARPAEQLRDWLPGAQIFVDNDANLGAVGELAAGAGRDCRDFVYVKMAPGLGAALVVDGRLYRGAGGLAGEIGHVQINELGHPCICGARGCLGAEMHIAALHGTGGNAGLAALAELFRRYEAGDAACGRTLSTMGGLLGEQLGAVANMLDPERVVISTDQTPPHPKLLDGIRDGIRRTALPAISDLPVLPSPLGVHAETVGAITLARERHAEGSGVR